MRSSMAYGKSIEYTIVEELFHLDGRDFPFIFDGNSWKPCRVSISKWSSSLGEWTVFGGYRSTEADSFHRSTCQHRPGFPRAFNHEELNFNEGMAGGTKHQLMYDPAVEMNDPWDLELIMQAHTGRIEGQERLENFHIVTRRSGQKLLLGFVMEDVNYEPGMIGMDFSAYCLDTFREHEAIFSDPLEPCVDCVQRGWVSMAVDLLNCHGVYGNELTLTGNDSLLETMRPNQWLILSVGRRRLALPYSVIESLKGYRWGELLCHPPV